MSKKNHNQAYESQTEQDDRNDRMEFQGVVEEAMPGTLFKIRCSNGMLAICTLSGKLRINRIRLLPGDAVTIEVSPYDVSRGRVTWRR